MTTEEKNICIIELLSKKSDWESWSEKNLAWGIWKGYKILLVGNGSTVGVDKNPSQSEFERALEGSTDLYKKIVKLSKLNKLAYEGLILLINTDSFVGKVAFGLVWNAKSPEFPKGNNKLAGDRLVNKSAPLTVLSLLKLKNEFNNSGLRWEWSGWMECIFGRAKNSNEWIQN